MPLTTVTNGQPWSCTVGQITRSSHKTIEDGRWLEKRLGVPFGSSGVADDIQNGRRVGNVERGARAAKDLEDGLTHFGDERVDAHERLDVTTGCTGVRDYHAPVGMADQDDRTGRALREERRDVRGVSGHPAQEVGRSEDGEALTLQLGRYGVPARSVGPCAVNENDRRLRHAAPL